MRVFRDEVLAPTSNKTHGSSLGIRSPNRDRRGANGKAFLNRSHIRSIFLLILLAVAISQATDHDRNVFFFLIFADPQFGMYTGDQGFEHETANFEFAIAAANRLRPAFVVVCGDLVNKPGHPGETAEYKRIAAKLAPTIPLYNVPGNHDVGNIPTADSLDRYREQFGPDHYTFRFRDMEGFVLNSSVIANPSLVAETSRNQESWLRIELEKARKLGIRRLVVFQHHPFFVSDPAEPDQYFNITGPARHAYLNLLRQYGVSHVFAGHLHGNAHGRDSTLEMVTTGPVGKPLGDARSGIGVVIVRDSEVEYHYYDFGALPENVELDKGR